MNYVLSDLCTVKPSVLAVYTFILSIVHVEQSIELKRKRKAFQLIVL